MNNILNDLYDEIITEATRSQHDLSGKDFKIGDEAEQYFIKLSRFSGYGWTPATSHEERIDHIDGKMFSPYTNRTYKIEIKSKKSNDRCPNDILFELRSRGENLKGWIYGKADYIAFLYEHKGQQLPYNKDVFLLLDRIKLVNIVEQATNTKWIMQNGKNTFVYDKNNLVNDTCAAIAPKLYIRGINDPWSVITRLSISNLLSKLQKDKDYFVMKYIEKKNQRELKATGTASFDQYKFKLL